MAKTKTQKPGSLERVLGVGQLLPANSMLLHVRVGEASMGKRKYEMSTGVNGSPIVHSKQTGKWFSLPWNDILALAEKAGIDTGPKLKNEN